MVGALPLVVGPETPRVLRTTQEAFRALNHMFPLVDTWFWLFLEQPGRRGAPQCSHYRVGQWMQAEQAEPRQTYGELPTLVFCCCNTTSSGLVVRAFGCITGFDSLAFVLHQSLGTIPGPSVFWERNKIIETHTHQPYSYRGTTCIHSLTIDTECSSASGHCCWYLPHGDLPFQMTRTSNFFLPRPSSIGVTVRCCRERKPISSGGSESSWPTNSRR